MTQPTTGHGRALLRDTAHHHIDCDVLATVPSACTCGLAESIVLIESEAGRRARPGLQRLQAMAAQWRADADVFEAPGAVNQRGRPVPRIRGAIAAEVARQCAVALEEALREQLAVDEGLDGAWAAVERVMPEDHRGPTIDRGWDDWSAEAWPPVDPDLGERDPIEGRGATPREALLALAAALPSRS